MTDETDRPTDPGSRDRLVESWVRAALKAEAGFQLDQLAALAIPVEELRGLARRFDRCPKGYRIDRAPGRRLATALCVPKDAEILKALVEGLVDRLRLNEEQDARQSDSPAELERLKRLLALREQETQSLRTDLTRSRDQQAEHRRHAESLQNERRLDHSQLASLRAELDAMRVRLAARATTVKPPVRTATEDRVRELERELEAMGRTEEGLRRIVAVRHARIRELEDRVAELLELTKQKGKKPKPEERVEEPALSEVFRLPRFTSSFYKSLEGKPRQSVEKGFQAALLFCIEGPSYPGLEVKQIGGQDLWSLRASRKLRVYFLPGESNEVEFLALVDREDQPTALRRLKDR